MWAVMVYDLKQASCGAIRMDNTAPWKRCRWHQGWSGAWPAAAAAWTRIVMAWKARQHIFWCSGDFLFCDIQFHSCAKTTPRPIHWYASIPPCEARYLVLSCSLFQAHIMIINSLLHNASNIAAALDLDATAQTIDQRIVVSHTTPGTQASLARHHGFETQTESCPRSCTLPPAGHFYRRLEIWGAAWKQNWCYAAALDAYPKCAA